MRSNPPKVDIKPPRKKLKSQNSSVSGSNRLSRSATSPPSPSYSISSGKNAKKPLLRSRTDPLPRAPTSLSRTLSGLPICTTCHAAAGSCQHTSMDFLPQVNSWRARQARMNFKRKLSTVEVKEPVFPKPSRLKKPKQEEQEVPLQKVMAPSPRNNIVLNVAKKECVACWEVQDMVVDFRCSSAPPESKVLSESGDEEGTKSNDPASLETHVACRECFVMHASMKIKENKLKLCPERGIYTTPCPMECQASFVKFATFDSLLNKDIIEKYHRFCALKYAEDVHVIWCPYDDCLQGAIPKSGDKVRYRQSVLLAPSSPLSESAMNSVKPDTNGGRLSGTSILEIIREEQEEELPIAQRKSSVTEVEHFVMCNACERPVCMECHKGHGAEVDCLSFRKSNPSRIMIDESSKACPGCGVMIFKDGGCNHMTCSACGHEFCWIHLIPWVEGGACQRDHWATTTGMTTVYNTKRVVLNSLLTGWNRCMMM